MIDIFKRFITFLKTGIKWTSFALGFALIGAVFVIFFRDGGNDGAPASFDESVVSRGDINETIKVSGRAELINEQALRFNLTGSVSNVHVSEGDEVGKDQLIMELDKTDLNNEIKQAEISLSNSEITLENLRKGNSEAEILKAQNSFAQLERNIEQNEVSFSITKQQYDLNVKNLGNAIAAAEQDLENKQRLYDIADRNLNSTKLTEERNLKVSEVDYESVHDDVISSVKSTIGVVDGVLLKINTVMEIEGYRSQSTNYHILIGATNSQAENTTSRAYSVLKNSVESLSSYLKEIEAGEFVFEDDYDLLSQTLALLEETSLLLENYSAVLDGSFPGTDLSNSTLESFRSEANSMESTINSQIKTINVQVSSLETMEDPELTILQSESSIAQKEDALDDAEYSLKQAEEALLSLKDSYDSDVENEKLKVISAESELNGLRADLNYQRLAVDDLIAGVDLSDIQKAENDVAVKKLALQKVRGESENYEIKAPFDGVITQIDYQAGDNILADDDKYVYIENPDLIKVVVSLDQIDIVEVKTGQKVNVYFDSFPEELFVGTLDEITQIPVETSGVVSYTVGIILDNPEKKIFSGMTASVEIIVVEVTDVIKIPSSYVTKRNDKSIVLKKTADGSKETEVVTGVDNDQDVEILSGLSEGDTVLSVAVTLTSATNQESGLFGGGPMGGGEPPADDRSTQSGGGTNVMRSTARPF